MASRTVIEVFYDFYRTFLEHRRGVPKMCGGVLYGGFRARDRTPPSGVQLAGGPVASLAPIPFWSLVAGGALGHNQ